MAEADDTPTTSPISWNEVARRVGSAEALLSLLCEKPIPARYQGLFYWPSYKVRDGAPGRIGPDWWAAARVDATTRLVIFLRPSKHRVFFVGDRAKPADSPPDRDEVLALGIDFATSRRHCCRRRRKPGNPHRRPRRRPSRRRGRRTG